MTAPDEPVTCLSVAVTPRRLCCDRGSALLARLPRQTGYLLLTEAQRRGSPGRWWQQGAQGTADFLRREGTQTLGWPPCLFRVLILGCRRGGVLSLPESFGPSLTAGALCSEGAGPIRPLLVGTADPGWTVWLSYLTVVFCLVRQTQCPGQSLLPDGKR